MQVQLTRSNSIETLAQNLIEEVLAKTFRDQITDWSNHSLPMPEYMPNQLQDHDLNKHSRSSNWARNFLAQTFHFPTKMIDSVQNQGMLRIQVS